MRLWTAMLGAWLAAGNGSAADRATLAGASRDGAAPLPRPAAEQSVTKPQTDAPVASVATRAQGRAP